MKRLAPALLCLSCNVNVPELESVHHRLELERVEKQAVAATLSEHKRKVEQLEQELAGILEPGAEPLFDPPDERTETFTELPAPDLFEGDRARLLRAQIREQQQSLLALNQTVLEVKKLEVREKELVLRRVDRMLGDINFAQLRQQAARQQREQGDGGRQTP